MIFDYTVSTTVTVYWIKPQHVVFLLLIYKEPSAL